MEMVFMDSPARDWPHHAAAAAATVGEQASCSTAAPGVGHELLQHAAAAARRRVLRVPVPSSPPHVRWLTTAELAGYVRSAGRDAHAGDDRPGAADCDAGS